MSELVATPAAFISILVFLPAVVALFISIAPINGEQAKWTAFATTVVAFVMSMMMIFGDGPVQFQAGVAEVREAGLYRFDTRFVSGDVFRISIDAGAVKYAKNGVVFYTSTVAPTFPLILDSAILNLGGTVTNARIAP